MTFNGFISYSHAADGRLAPAVQRGLHRLAKPWHRRRALWIFRDQTGLAVTPAPDGSTRIGPPARAEVGLWYPTSRPQSGWSTGEWPTPLPDPEQLSDYGASVDRITSLPR
jgi:hypothetical protein